MTTSAITPAPTALPAGATFGEPQDTPTTIPAQTSLPAGATFGEPAEAAATIAADGTPKFAPYSASSFGRYTTPENYEKWASTPPKSGVDSRPGEYEAWTGANTPGGAKETLLNSAKVIGEAGLAAGTAMGVTAIPEVLPPVLIHTVEGVKALGVWAEAHPYKAFMLYQVAKELLPGAKKAMGLVKAVPEVTP